CVSKEQCEKKKPHTEALCLHKSSCVRLLFFIGRMPDSEEKRSFFELLHCGLERSDTQKRCVYTKAAVCGFFFS
ncbi:hypothetical protein, partial [uncultured Clostridium sp.]|uniref:hypothetical protein n=1 Tax=uncultured Clostridium sp. TaxID=59620 RepID=UPI002587C30A